jgi:hypothetical protein
MGATAIRGGSVNGNGQIVGGVNVSNRTYAITVPVVTNAGPLDFLVRVDGSAVNALLKLDGGMDLNSHLGLGASNTFTWGLLDLRDNKPGVAIDLFLGYEQPAFHFRFGPEKFAARNTDRDTVVSTSAEIYSYVVGSDVTTNVTHGSGLGHGYSEETCQWVYHDPAASNNIVGQPIVRQRSSTAAATPVIHYVKVGYQFQINKCFLYYTTDGSTPEGTYGVGQGTTQVAPAAFAGRDASDRSIDWWRGIIPAQSAGTVVRYKMALHKNNANPIVDYAEAKHYALTEFAIAKWNPAGAQVWLHNDLATNQVVTGLAEGFHILRARVFLPRSGKSSVFNTFSQTFYYDTAPPDGAIAFPQNGEAIRSASYDVVVRADETTSAVEFNINDSDPNNDDVTTGLHRGNGLSNGLPVFARANGVMPAASVDALYPQLPQEFRFTYFAVPSNGQATLTIRLKEFTSAAFPNHFRQLTRTVNLFEFSDSDGDGLPDTWEVEHGLNPNSASGEDGAEGDPDHDKFSNLQEYLAGTDPRDASSRLRIVSLANGGPIVTWSSVPGKVYQVFAAADATAAFAALSGSITATGTTTRFTNNAPISTKAFYRVRLLR